MLSECGASSRCSASTKLLNGTSTLERRKEKKTKNKYKYTMRVVKDLRSFKCSIVDDSGRKALFAATSTKPLDISLRQYFGNE